MRSWLWLERRRSALGFLMASVVAEKLLVDVIQNVPLRLAEARSLLDSQAITQPELPGCRNGIVCVKFGVGYRARLLALEYQGLAVLLYVQHEVTIRLNGRACHGSGLPFLAAW